MVSTTFVRAAGTRVRCTRMRGSVRPSRRQRAAIDFEFLPSSAFSFLGAGENRPFETRFSEVIDRSKKELLSRYGRGVKGRSGEKSADKKGMMQCRGEEPVAFAIVRSMHVKDNMTAMAMLRYVCTSSQLVGLTRSPLKS